MDEDIYEGNRVTLTGESCLYWFLLSPMYLNESRITISVLSMQIVPICVDIDSFLFEGNNIPPTAFCSKPCVVQLSTVCCSVMFVLFLQFPTFPWAR